MDLDPRDTSSEEQSAIQAEEALVEKILGRIRHARKKAAPAFKRMRADMDLVRWGRAMDPNDVAACDALEEFPYDDEQYVANIAHRHVQQRTASLYAKNPKASARLRERKIFQVWDEKPDSLMMAQQTLAAMNALPPEALAKVPDVQAQVRQALQVVQDHQQGTEQKRMLQGVADALVILFHYYMDEQEPSFKKQMKQLVRRALTCGVAYLKLGFQREYENRPEITSQIEDHADRLAHIDRLMNELAEGDVDEHSAEAEELKQSLRVLQQQESILVREGLVFEFLRATAVIVDPRCRSLDGFVGADFVAVEYEMAPHEVEEVYGMRLSENNLSDRGEWDFDKAGSADLTEADGEGEEPDAVLVWEYYHKPSGLVYTVCNASKLYLKEPGPPDVQVENFYPIRTLVFNDVEHEKELYPPSDASLLRAQQTELNRVREALREHRLASTPQYAAAGHIEEKDIENLVQNVPHAVVKLQSLQPGDKVSDVLAQIQKAPIDPNHYTANHVMDDIFFVVGSQEADLGAVSGATATETSLAASSRSTAITSNVDDLDDFFTDVARAGGQIMLRELSPEQVQKIVGAGAVWPNLTREEIVEEVYLEIEAGSSGRPNQAEDIALLERIVPFLLQVPGLDQIELAKEILRRFDDKLDLTKLIAPGAPSTVALNQMAAPGTGDPATDPMAQGGQGAANAAPNPAPPSDFPVASPVLPP